MRLLITIFVFALGIAVALWRHASDPIRLPKGIPVSALADGKPHPDIGLIAPWPDWMTLPESGTVIGAGLYPARPPYGAAAVVLLKFDGQADGFTAGYAQTLAHAGFSYRRIASPPNLGIDAPYATYEADDRASGKTVYVTIRDYRTPRYAQLTFWNAPAPRQ